MTFGEKRDKLQEFCSERVFCCDCPIRDFNDNLGYECEFDRYSDECIEEAYKIAFGGECDVFCEDCKYGDVDEDEFPCNECLNLFGHLNKFEPVEEDTTADTVQHEEINHPDRYKSGKYECIDVMQDIYGNEAIRHFCICNAFKYIWRFEKKNGVQDLQKAIWYLNKCVEVMNDEN